MAVLEVVFAGLVAHFGFNSGNTAVLPIASGHSPIIAVKVSGGDSSFLGAGDDLGGGYTKFSLRGRHIRIVLQSTKVKHDATFDDHIPRIEDITGGHTPLSNVPAGMAHPHVAGYVDYSYGTLYGADCYFKDEETLKLMSHVSSPFCAAKYTRFKSDEIGTSEVTIENANNRTQYFTVPADSTIYIYNTSPNMAGGYAEYRWLVDDDKGLATFVPTGNPCPPYDCKIPPIPGLGIHLFSVTVECVNTQWP